MERKNRDEYVENSTIDDTIETKEFIVMPSVPISENLRQFTREGGWG